jgi:hypothetical protein
MMMIKTMCHTSRDAPESRGNKQYPRRLRVDQPFPPAERKGIPSCESIAKKKKNIHKARHSRQAKRGISAVAEVAV